MAQSTKAQVIISAAIPYCAEVHTVCTDSPVNVNFFRVGYSLPSRNVSFYNHYIYAHVKQVHNEPYCSL